MTVANRTFRTLSAGSRPARITYDLAISRLLSRLLRRSGLEAALINANNSASVIEDFAAHSLGKCWVLRELQVHRSRFSLWDFGTNGLPCPPSLTPAFAWWNIDSVFVRSNGREGSIQQSLHLPGRVFSDDWQAVHSPVGW